MQGVFDHAGEIMDFPALLASIRRAFPESSLEPVPDERLAGIRADYPGLPTDYLDFLRYVGAGRIGAMGLAIYDGPCDPSDIFDDDTAAEIPGILFFADDFGGWQAGFDTNYGWRIVGVSSAEPVPLAEPDASFGAFVERWVMERNPR